ncbi:MAG: putative transport system permease protein [Frankiaceae bacterium]|nr:putative transport system permease protein [Frankiaceae bacterium]
MSLWLRGLVARRSGRILLAGLGVATAVALLASLGSFLAASKSTMTLRSIERVGVDWQVQVAAGADPAQVDQALAAESAVQAKVPVSFADVAGLVHTSTAGDKLTTGAGVVVGVPPDWARQFPQEVRYLVGAHDGVLVAQQTASNLHVLPGDTVTISLGQAKPVTVPVAGVVDLPQADSLFQTVGAPAGSRASAPPDNVLLMPATQWHSLFDAPSAAGTVQTHQQVHVRLAHALPHDPSAAYTTVAGLAHHVEVASAGAAVVGDNLGAALSAARQDAAYAEMLFLFLGVPGAALAALLTALIADTGAPRRRKEQALLRLRGANRRQLGRLAAVEPVLVGVVGIVLGLAAAVLTGWASFGSASFGGTTATAVGWATFSALAGLLVALLTMLVPALRDVRRLTVAGANTSGAAPRVRPLWERLGADLILLAAGLAVYWATSRGGYQIVLAPEGVPSISISYWAFAGPALIWIGSGLFVSRCVSFALRRGRRPLRALTRPFAGTLSGTVAAALSRQRALISRVVVLVALAIAFAASTATFNATYQQQARADALLTNGADVTVTEPPGANVSSSTVAQVAAVPGVSHVEPMQHRFAYVGADLQDLYGVNPSTIASATALQDAYFVGGTAKQVLARIAAQPDAALFSAETVKDYQLQLGDTVRLRLQDATTKQYAVVPFHYVGVVHEFPTAPKDSFIVANSSYIATATHDASIGQLLVTTKGAQPGVVAQRIRATVGPAARIEDLTTTRAVVGSSLTSVDLSGLTRMELVFALLLTVAATGLLVTLSFTERRRTLSMARLLGARPRQVGGFVWSEIAVIGVSSLALGAVLAWSISEMLVKVLTGVFDPPPSVLAVPWLYLLLALATLVAGLGVAGVLTVRRAIKAPVSILRSS